MFHVKPCKWAWQNSISKLLNDILTKVLVIMKANDVKHHISQMQPDLMILKALKREMKT
jgi:hypothetical protein